MLSKVGSANNYINWRSVKRKQPKTLEICNRFIVDSEWIQKNVRSMKKQKIKEESSITIWSVIVLLCLSEDVKQKKIKKTYHLTQIKVLDNWGKAFYTLTCTVNQTRVRCTQSCHILFQYIKLALSFSLIQFELMDHPRQAHLDERQPVWSVLLGNPTWHRQRLSSDVLMTHGPLTRYAILQVAHAPRMPGTFSPPPRVSYPDMHYVTCVTHVPWCMPGSLTNGFLWSRWRGKRSRHSRRMRNPRFYVSGKKPMSQWLFGDGLGPHQRLLSSQVDYQEE